jgi:hypothetical protein
MTGKSDKGQIHGIEHQLDTHEDDDCILSGQDAKDAEREEDGT